jgi:hypothetical protein
VEHKSQQNLLRLSLSTLVEVSPLLGHPLEDRAKVRKAQDAGLVRQLMAASATPLKDPSRAHWFNFGCLDFLPCRALDGQPHFVPLEMNGTGMAGITSLPLFVLDTILHSLQAIPGRFDDSPNVIVPFSGTEALKTSSSWQLIYERFIYAQAIKEAIQQQFGHARIVCFSEFLKLSATERQPSGMVVIGPAKDILSHIQPNRDQVWVDGTPFHASLHDPFCSLVDEVLGQVPSPDHFHKVNGMANLVADKGHVYRHYNHQMAQYGSPLFQQPVRFEHCFDEPHIIAAVQRFLDQGTKVVIKPKASGLGRGIEFFWPGESLDRIQDKVHQSTQAAQKYYGIANGSFPYTVCEYIDSSTINAPEHPAHGHKYELRIAVFRDENVIKAVPSIAKIAPFIYDPASTDRLRHLNNVALSKNLAQAPGQAVGLTETLLPLTHPETLALLGLTVDQLVSISQFASQFVASLIDVAAEPARFVEAGLGYAALANECLQP